MKKRSLDKYTDEEIFHESAKRLRAKQTHLPNAPKLEKCQKCGKMLNARQRRFKCPEHGMEIPK